MVRLKAEYGFKVEWQGFVLHPEIPVGGTTAQAYFGAARAAAFHDQLGRFAAGFGVPLGQPEKIPNTRRALAMTEYARDQGKLEEFQPLVMTAHWRDGIDIESPTQLAELAEQVGLDPRAASDASESDEFLERVKQYGVEAAQRQVTGIPTCFIGEKRIVGCQPFPTFLKAAGL